MWSRAQKSEFFQQRAWNSGGFRRNFRQAIRCFRHHTVQIEWKMGVTKTEFLKQSLEPNTWTRWWFQIFFIFTPYSGKIPNLTTVIFFKGVGSTTNFTWSFLLTGWPFNNIFNQKRGIHYSPWIRKFFTKFFGYAIRVSSDSYLVIWPKKPSKKDDLRKKLPRNQALVKYSKYILGKKMKQVDSLGEQPWDIMGGPEWNPDFCIQLSFFLEIATCNVYECPW